MINKRLGKRQRQILKIYSKELRDKLAQIIEDWDKIATQRLLKDGLSNDETAFLMNKIINEANCGLVWRSLDKKERYNTPFFLNEIAALRKIHPDLEVKNSLRHMVIYPVFKKEDIEAAFLREVEPLKFDEESNMKGN